MRSKQKFTNFEKRKLTHDRSLYTQQTALKNNHPLDLPAKFQLKISQAEHKKLKEAFFIEANISLKMGKKQFAVAMRSMGIIQTTAKLNQIFNELEQQQMTWQQFLQAYVSRRHLKGSYNQLATAVYGLDNEYKGNWDDLFLDLKKIGKWDKLTSSQIEIFRKQILKDKTINNELLINSLLGYK